MIDVLTSRGLPAGCRRLADYLKKGVCDGVVDPFEDVLYAQGGRPVGPEGGHFTPQEILTMDWLAEKRGRGHPRVRRSDRRSETDGAPAGRAQGGQRVKILAVSDIESKYLWDRFEPNYLADVDLIISCGDLKATYLSFLATFSRAPVLYVCGNHDADYVKRPPEGCVCIDDKVYTFRGVRIAGLGGSMRYKPGPFQYTERQMERRAWRLEGRIRRAGGVDILVSHAPVRGCNDGSDPAPPRLCVLRRHDRQMAAPAVFARALPLELRPFPARADAGRHARRQRVRALQAGPRHPRAAAAAGKAPLFLLFQNPRRALTGASEKTARRGGELYYQVQQLRE